MVNDTSEKIQAILQETVGIDDDPAAVASFAKYFEETATNKPTNESDTELEAVHVELGKGGDITIATTTKLPNLKFNFGALLLEIVSSGMSASSAKNDLPNLAIIGLRFLQKIQQLATLSIEPKDGQVLLAIAKLEQERQIITVDKVVETLAGKLSETEIAKSLENLETLGCLSSLADEIFLNETILVKQASE